MGLLDMVYLERVFNSPRDSLQMSGRFCEILSCVRFWWVVKYVSKGGDRRIPDVLRDAVGGWAVLFYEWQQLQTFFFSLHF